MNIKEFFKDAVERQASDIFMIPGMPLALKINGRIENIGEEKIFPAEMDNYIREIYTLSGSRDMSRVMTLGDDDFSFSIVGLSRFRASVMKQRGSLAAVIRIVRFDLPNPADIHIPETVLNIASMKKGMVLVTGAAGSGKSTTLACIIDRINQTRNAHVITLEDPIEYLHHHQHSVVTQREIGHDTASYVDGLRAFPAPGAGCYSLRRDAGLRNHPDSHDCGRDGPSADLHPPHHRSRQRHRPHYRRFPG